jgi:hypothetical protein
MASLSASASMGATLIALLTTSTVALAQTDVPPLAPPAAPPAAPAPSVQSEPPPAPPSTSGDTQPAVAPSPASPAAPPEVGPSSQGVPAAPPYGALPLGPPGGTDASALPPPGPRSAGYHNGTFFIRSPDDVFRLYLLGRVHADWLGQFGPGTSKLPPGSGLQGGFYLRRARLELGGEFFQLWQWQVGAEFSSSTSIDNAAGQQTTPTCTPNPTSGALPCTNKENAVENGTVKPIPTDVFVNFGPSPWANVEVGQFYLPFTLENRISDNTTPFLERSVAVRNIGAPLQRDIGAMFWGESPDRTVYYSAAVLNGDGPNRPNVDNRYDFAGRVVVRPAASLLSSPTRFAQLGFSVKAGSRDPAQVGYDLPSLSTQGGFPFWKPTYKDSLARTIHIMPSQGQWGLAGDLYVPVENFDLTGEFIYNVYNTREAVDGYQISPFTEREGDLKGYAWYVAASYWILGNHDLIGYPSYGRPIHVDFSKPQNPPQNGLQVLAKFESLALTYAGSARGGKSDSRTPNGDIDVNDVEFGLNYWATKHLRVGINYTHYMFPNATPVSATSAGGPQQSSVQRAVSPAQSLATGVDDSARGGSGTLEEVQARVGVQF